MRSLFGNMLVFVVSCLVALGLVELSLRVFDVEVARGPLRYGVTEFDPLLGWVNLRNVRTSVTTPEFTYQVEHNAEGMRDRVQTSRAPGEFRVSLLGDSFAWGWGINYGERFTEVVENLSPRVNIMNFGVSGYSPLQYLLSIENALSADPDYVVLTFSLGSDLTDNIASANDPPKPYSTLTDDGELEIIGVPLARPDDEALQCRLIAYTCRLVVAAINKVRVRPQVSTAQEAVAEEEDLIEIAHTPDARLTPDQRRTVGLMYQLNEEILRLISVQVEEKLGPNRFAVLLAPSIYEYGINLAPGADPDLIARGIRESLTRLQIPFIDARDALSRTDFWPQDGHWTPQGHKKIGIVLEKYIVGAMSLSAGDKTTR